MDVIKQIKIQVDYCERLIDLMISSPDIKVNFPKEVQSILSLHISKFTRKDISEAKLPIDAFNILDWMIDSQLEWLTQVSVLQFSNGCFIKRGHDVEPNIKMLYEIESEDIFYLRPTLSYLTNILKK